MMLEKISKIVINVEKSGRFPVIITLGNEAKYIFA